MPLVQPWGVHNMLTQREYDIRQLEAELKMQKLFDDWRKAFLAERAQGQQPQQSEQVPEELKAYGAVR